MGWTALPYLLATGGAVVDTDMSAVADQEFSRRNSHYVFTEDYRVKCAVGAGATITRLRISAPTLNAISAFNVWPLNLSSANVPSPPRVSWFDTSMPRIPMNEEFQFLITDGASENAAAVVLPMTPQHTKNIPQGDLLTPIRATSTITQVAGGWSAPGTLALEQSLRGGVYSIVGAEAVGTGTFLFRIIFPSSRFYRGRRLRPGWLAQQAIGDLPEARIEIDPMYFGEWGRFHSFELPQVEVWCIAASASVAHEFRLWLVYLGTDQESLLRNWATQGWT